MQRIIDLVEMGASVLPLILAVALFALPVVYFLYAVIMRLLS